MAPLTRSELEALDRAIDAGIPELPLLGLPRDAATLAVLTAYQVRMFALKGSTAPDRAKFFAVSQELDGLSVALRWVLERCPALSPERCPASRLDLHAAGQLLEVGLSYAEASRLMSSLIRGWVAGEREQDGTVRVFLADPGRLPLGYAQTFLAVRNSPFGPEPALGAFQTASPRELRITTRPSGKVAYSVSRAFFNDLAARTTGALESVWPFGQDVDLDGYHLKDFHAVWSALFVMCLMHWEYCRSVLDSEGGRLPNLIRIDRAEFWRNELCQWTGLSRSRIARILDDLTVDLATSGASAGKRLEAAYRPFFRLSSGERALCDALVLDSNIGRSVSNLLLAMRPRAYSGIQDRRSGWYIDQLRPQLAARGLGFHTSVTIPKAAGGGDIDLLLVDEPARVLLACEVKAFRAIHSEAEAQMAIQELEHGVQQSRRSLDWLRTRPSALASQVGAAVEYEPLAMVLSESYLPLDRLPDDEIPIVNDRVLQGVLRHPSRPDLRTLYRIARERRYLPKPDVHYRLVGNGGIVECGGVRFRSDVPQAEPIRNWDPDRDIDFSGLS